MIEQQGAGSGWGRPLALLDGAAIHWAFAPIRFPAILNASPTPHAMASPALTLAVVDDHHLMRPGLAHTVGDWPHARQVVEAENGVDFERVIAEVGHIHIAIIDRQMPKRDGFDTLRWMARHHPRTLCIMISFDMSPHDVRLALRLGARAVLCKDIRPAEFYKALHAVHTQGYYYNELMDRDLRRSVADELALRDPDTLWDTLSDREKEVLLLYADPRVKDLQEAAARLGISYNTAETHRHNGCRKLDLHSKADVIHAVKANGWK
jgi:DNA-binding NarL/FixJ family response regulator